MLPNRASGSEIGLSGRMSVGFYSGKKSALRPAEGRPECRFQDLPDQNPAEIRPGSPTSGPVALLLNIGHANEARIENALV